MLRLLAILGFWMAVGFILATIMLGPVEADHPSRWTQESSEVRREQKAAEETREEEQQRAWAEQPGPPAPTATFRP